MASLVSRGALLLNKDAAAGAQASAVPQLVFVALLSCLAATFFLDLPRVLSPRLLDATLLSGCLLASGDWRAESAAELVASAQRYNVALALVAVLLPRCRVLLVATAMSTLASSLRALRLPQGLDASHAEQLLGQLVIARVGIIVLLAWSRCLLLQECAATLALGTLVDSASQGFCAVDRRSGALLRSSAALRASLGDLGLAGHRIEEWATTEADAEAVRAMLRGDKPPELTVIARPGSQPEAEASSVRLVPCPLPGHELLLSVEPLRREPEAAERARAEAETQTEPQRRAGPGSEAGSARSGSERNVSPSMRSRSEHSSRSGRTMQDLDAGFDRQTASGHRTNQTVTSVEAAVAQFKTTQPQVCANSVLWLMSHWNTPRDSLRSNCCPYHAQLAIAAKIVSVLQTRPCNPLWSPFLTWQCTTCSCMNSHDGLECTICGSGGTRAGSGPPSAASKYYGSDVESIAEMPDDAWAEQEAWQGREEAEGPGAS